MFITECDFYSLSGPRAQQRSGSMSLDPLGTTRAVCGIFLQNRQESSELLGTAPD